MNNHCNGATKWFTLDAVLLPVRISPGGGATYLDDISTPESRRYGQHLSAEDLHDFMH